jgi:hypothetical protein
MSTWILVLVMLNVQGHAIYKEPNRPFHTLQECETHAEKLRAHGDIKNAMCVESYDVKQ